MKQPNIQLLIRYIRSP